MKTITETENSKSSVNARTLIVSLIVIIGIVAVGYGLHVSKVNYELEHNLRYEKLRNERLLSEKLELEKDFRSTQESLKNLERKIRELDIAITTANQRLIATESELAQSKKKRNSTN
jgi:uncharacterized membrane-anchored protein YhcB (DUF1043 family)